MTDHAGKQVVGKVEVGEPSPLLSSTEPESGVMSSAGVPRRRGT